MPDEVDDDPFGPLEDDRPMPVGCIVCGKPVEVYGLTSHCFWHGHGLPEDPDEGES